LIRPCLVGDEVDGDAEVAEAAGAPHAMQVRLGVLGKVEVDHNVHGLNVDTSLQGQLIPLATSSDASSLNIQGVYYVADDVASTGTRFS
jgi:hypothetical protein